MEGVGQWNDRLDNNVNPLFCLRKLDEESTAVSWEGLVFPDSEKGWVVVFGHESCSTDVPFVELGAVTLHDDIEGAFGDVGRSDTHRCNRDKAGHGFVDTLACVGVSITAGSVCDRGAIIVNDGSDVKSLDGTGTSVLVVSAQEETSSGVRGLDYHIVTLTNVDVQNVGGVRGDRNEIRGNNGELMVVEVNLVCRLDSAVDKSKQVFLARCEGLGSNKSGSRNFAGLVIAVPDVHSVDETRVKQNRATVGSGSTTGSCGGAWDRGSVLGKIVSGINSEMRPILELEWT